EMVALAADRTVGMAAARREVVGADDGGAPVDPAPAADVVRGRELGDPTFVVVAREAGDRADLVEAAGIEQQVDALATSELAAIALADHARVGRVRAEPGVRDPLQRLHRLEGRRPAVLAVGADRPGALDGRDGGDDLA